MTKNTGVSYEILTQAVFDAILNTGEVKTIDVKRNVTLQGKETTHQIDLCWTFQVGGINYYTVVQTKNWAFPVKKGQLLQFKSVLADLPNQPRGIFVTRTGYQKGALEVAEANGILLYELREPTARDERHRLRAVVLNLFVCMPYTGEIRLVPDQAWMIQEALRLRLREIPGMRLSLEPEDTMLRDENGSDIVTVKSLTDSFYPPGFEELPPTRVVHLFEEPTFIVTGATEFPRLKVSGIEATIRVGRVEETITIDADDLVGFILRNVLEGTDQALDKGGTPLT
jgi:hypothetical protein